MDGSNVVHGHVPGVPSPRRPKTQQSSSFNHLPTIKDSRDYIMITQEILDAFKERVVKSHKVNLKLNPVRLKSSRRHIVSRRHLQPTQSERAHFLYTKAHTSIDLREHVRNRPVKVFVDDITKNSTGTSEVTSGSGQELREMLKRRPTFVKAPSKIPDAVMKRSLESGDEDGAVPDDIIEKVARANTIHVSHAPVLPEIRAGPCPIHVKHNKGRLAEEEPDSLSGNIKDFKSQKKNRLTHPIKSITIQQNPACQENVTNKRVDINVKIPEQFPTTKAPALPKHMSSKDYVMTWLIHGSAPQGSNHFPEIIPSQAKTKSKSKHTPRNMHTNE